MSQSLDGEEDTTSEISHSLREEEAENVSEKERLMKPQTSLARG
uniref:Uncharacterized protein n=1 Tax=Anguilla anguilla TaxID=7936 RepID=A0A0E9U141_ANGAN